MIDDLPPTLWILCHDRGPDDAVYLWTVPPHCTPDEGKILLVFTIRAGAEDYADTMADEMFVAREVATTDWPRLVALAGSTSDVAVDFDTSDARFMSMDEFEEMVGTGASVPVVIPGKAF